MGRPPLEFWFEFASTYSYLAAARVEGAAGAADVEVAWRPFLLGPIFAAQGWSTSPFNLYPAKGRYMWRDMERLCEKYALPFRRPSSFPRNGLLAARVAGAAAGERWCADFVRAVFHANFAADREISQPAVVGEILTALGRDARSLIASASLEENKQRLREQTSLASRLGIFGAPTFVSGSEIFWGNDRLEDALAYHRRSRQGTME